MITPGGEEAFVSKMLCESIMLGQRCRHLSTLSRCSCTRTQSPTTPSLLVELVQGHPTLGARLVPHRQLPAGSYRVSALPRCAPYFHPEQHIANGSEMYLRQGPYSGF